jgi:hypothetical protein
VGVGARRRRHRWNHRLHHLVSGAVELFERLFERDEDGKEPTARGLSTSPSTSPRYAWEAQVTAGVGKGFAPSVQAANAALGAAVPVRQDRHPPGTEGTAYSLDQMAKFVRDGRNDPRMRAWAGRVLIAAGKPQTVKGQAQAILDELRKKTVYVQDPVNTELMAKPHVTLCLDDKGLCMPAADCFPEGTLLLREDLKIVAIEDVGIGDRIWGRDAWTEVTAVWSKDRLSVDSVEMNNGSTALLTGDHHVYVLRCDRHENRAENSPACACPDEELRLDRVRVSTLQAKDRLIQPNRDNSIFSYFGSKEKSDKKLRVRSIHKNVTIVPCYDISTADHYVYLPEHDVTVSNCDDLVIAFASAMMSIGIETKIVGQAYGTTQATHVICAILDPDTGWEKVDPSSSKYKVGQSYPATKEWWMDPISGSISESAHGAKTTLGQEPESGDFIGVGAVPVQTPTGVGVIPMAHAFSPITHGASYVPVGLERGLVSFPEETPAQSREAKEFAFSQQLAHGLGRAPEKK